MAYVANWRGTVGLINPTRGTGSIEELTRLLPVGIGLIVIYNDTSHGTMKEFESLAASYEKQIRDFAERAEKVDMIHLSGTPPSMLMGFEKERALIDKWEKELNIPVFTSCTNQVRALRAMGIQRFVGMEYDFEDTSITSRYFRDAGLEPIAIEKLPGRWEDVGLVSYQTVYSHIKKTFLAHRREAQGIYLQGAKWRILDLIEPLEQDLGVPVIHPVAAQSWEIQRRLTVRQPRTGYGRLLAEMPLD